MVTTKTQSLLSLLFEQQPSDTISSEEVLEGLKDKLERFFDSSYGANKLKAKGVRMEYIPGEPEFYEDGSGSLNENVIVNIPDVDYLEYEIHTFVDPQFEPVLKFDIDFRDGPDRPFRLLRSGTRRREELPSSNKLVDTVFSVFEEVFVEHVDNKHIVAQVPQLKLAREIIDLFKTEYNDIEVVSLNRHLPSVFLDCRVKKDNEEPKQFFVKVALKTKGSGFIKGPEEHTLIVSITGEQGTEEYYISVGEEDYQPELIEFLNDAIYRNVMA